MLLVLLALQLFFLQVVITVTIYTGIHMPFQEPILKLDLHQLIPMEFIWEEGLDIVVLMAQLL